MTRRIIKIILNLVGIAFYIVAFVGFFMKYIYAWIEGVGTVGQYYGWQLALNFEGMPQNLGTLFPMLSILVALVYGIVALIIKFARLHKDPKPSTGGVLKPMLIALLYLLCAGVITMFLCLSTHNILGLQKPDDVAGYYQGVGPYLTAYFSLLGGLVMFICESGLIKDLPLEEVKEEKVEAKPTPKVETKQATKPLPQANPLKDAKPQPKVEAKVETKEKSKGAK